jgi:hypothetical protein
MNIFTITTSLTDESESLSRLRPRSVRGERRGRGRRAAKLGHQTRQLSGGFQNLNHSHRRAAQSRQCDDRCSKFRQLGWSVIGMMAIVM